MTLVRPLAANKGKRRKLKPSRIPGIVRVYGDVNSRGTPPELVADEMACQGSMQERARRLSAAIARGLVTSAMRSEA